MHEVGNFLSVYGSNETEGEPVSAEIVEYLVLEATKYLSANHKNLPNPSEGGMKVVFDILGTVFINGKHHLKMLEPRTVAEYKVALKAGFSLRKEFLDHSQRTLASAKPSLRDLALSTDELYQAREEWEQRSGLANHPHLTQFVEKVETRTTTVPQLALYLLIDTLKLIDPQKIEAAKRYIPSLQKQSLVIRGKLFQLLAHQVGVGANPVFITDDQLISTVNMYAGLDEAEQESVRKRTQAQFLQELPPELINNDTEVLVSQFLNQIDAAIQSWMRLHSLHNDQLSLEDYWKKKDSIFSLLPVQAISPDLVESQLLTQYTEIGAPSLWSDTTKLNGIMFPSHNSIQAGLRLFRAAGYQKSAEFASLRAADNLMENYYSTKRELENKIRRLQEQKTQVEEFLSENKDILERTELYPILDASKRVYKQKQTLRKYDRLKKDRATNILKLAKLEKLKTQDPIALKLGVLELEATTAVNSASRSLARLSTTYKGFPRIGSYVLETVPEFQKSTAQSEAKEVSNKKSLVEKYSWCSTALTSVQQLLESITTQTNGTASLFRLPKYLEANEGSFRVFLLNKIIPRVQGRIDANNEYLRKTGIKHDGTYPSENENIKQVSRDLRSKSEIWETRAVSRFLQQVLQEEIRLLSKSVAVLENSIRAQKMLDHIKTASRTGQVGSSLQKAAESVNVTRISNLSNEMKSCILTDSEIEQVTDTAVAQTKKVLAQYRYNPRMLGLRFPLDQDPLEFLAEYLRSNEGKQKKLKVLSQEVLIRSLIEAAPNNFLIPVENFRGLTLTQVFEAIAEREAFYELTKTHETIETSLAADQELLDQAQLLEKYQAAQTQLSTITSQLQSSEEMLARSDLDLTDGLFELNLAVSDTEYALIQSRSTILDPENE